jgi:hypothetical protein
MGWGKSGFVARSLAVVCVLALCLVCLVACGSSTNTLFTIDADESGIHAIAVGGANGEGVESIDIERGRSLSVGVVVNEGTFHVRVTDEGGASVFDKDVTESATYALGIDGAIGVEVTATGADGSVDVTQM